MAAAVYVTDVREYSCADQVVCIEIVTGGKVQSLHMPLRIARIASARFVRFLADHDSAGEVVKMRSR